MRLGSLLQSIAPINDWFEFPGLKQLFEGKQIFNIPGCGYIYLLELKNIGEALF
jgi:hypothetical protein